MDNYPDKNGDGIPDAFEDRRPISEILNKPQSSVPTPYLEPFPRDTNLEVAHGRSVVVEIEKIRRAPRKGEYFIIDSMIEQANHDWLAHCHLIIIKRVISGSLEGL